MKQRLGIALLVAFVALDIVLVSLALRRPTDPPKSDVVADVRPSATPSASGSAAASPSRAARTTAAAPPGSLFLDVAGDGTILRASRGRCADQPATVAASRADGRRLRDLDVPGLDEVLAVDATAVDDLSIVGLDADCALTTFRSDDRGETWTRDAGAVGTWHLAEKRRTDSVGTPGGVLDAPCVPTAVAGVDRASARLLCGDDSVYGSSDGGTSWVLLGRLSGGSGIAFGSPSSGWGRASTQQCEASVVRTTNGGSAWEEQACIADAGEPRAIAADGDTVVVQTDEVLTRSTDRGATFEPVLR